ncbi:MAG: hypothetical protein KDK99_16075, partial [Verrucomicrobiales bacterium]|nr:hypothetical protein [Verrucomicrobiales bacterium]
GSDQGITSGMTFNLRRGSAIVGQVRIGSIIEATESVADIIAGSLPVGVTPKEGDELIQITGS